jgi:hypothetical protein
MTATATQQLSPAHFHALQSLASPPPSPQELFDLQVQLLRDAGLTLPDDELTQLRDLLPSRPGLFYVIPNQAELPSLSDLISLIEVDGQHGTNTIAIDHLKDRRKAMPQAHLLLDVRDGTERNPNQSSGDLQRTITGENRLPLTAFEGVIQGIMFPYTLGIHRLVFLGSSYLQSPPLAPTIHLGYKSGLEKAPKRQPVLSAIDFNSPSSRAALYAPSAGRIATTPQ